MTISPGLNSREGLAFISVTFTFPALHASVANERVLKTRVAQSHLSIRVECFESRMSEELGLSQSVSLFRTVAFFLSFTWWTYAQDACLELEGAVGIGAV